jgi:beta-phosphoglucomutase-like phosphatase (HAD superfamily)
MSHRIAGSMIAALQPVEGALAAVRAIAGAGIAVAVASNSAREELHAKLRRLGLASMFEGRTFSFQDVARPKPAPDMYLAAARACGAIFTELAGCSHLLALERPLECAALVRQTALGVA